MNPRTIGRPERLSDAAHTLQRAIELDAQGRIPESVRAFMLATPALRLLRVLYGVDGNGALAWRLLLQAAGSAWESLQVRIQVAVLGEEGFERRLEADTAKACRRSLTQAKESQQ